MNDNEGTAQHKHSVVSKKQSMLFVQIVPSPENETSGSHCMDICLVVFIFGA